MFPCTACGVCCRRVNSTRITRWLDRGDGTCRHFEPDGNRCGIYTSRPIICRVDEMFNAYYSHMMTLAEFYRLNADCCNQMQDEKGIPQRYRVDPARKI